MAPAETTTLKRRLLLFAIILSVAGFIVYAVAIATPYWVLVDIPPTSLDVNGNVTVNKTHSGLWQRCLEYASGETKCHYIRSLDPTVSEGANIDEQFSAIHRTSVVFAIIALLLSAGAHVSAFYTFNNTRYMYKRLAAFVFLIAGACVLVQLELTITAIKHAEKLLPQRIPKGSVVRYGYCYGASWFTFVAFILAAIVFLINSGKKKRELWEDESRQSKKDSAVIIHR